ncbi:hypothetical protein GCM10010844_00690 [Deinococcus radiotolerans]|uniref:Uncharacterized protein n=1 Tax=Deinococcus radiotolerans TaxID=1309407 RepID=A0ABQ2FDU1_9DEIO|nr:hypothetical protein GCM10010844_00690 [Deinococcus radiotolerans]
MREGQVQRDGPQAPGELPAAWARALKAAGQVDGPCVLDQLGVTVKGVLVAFMEHVKPPVVCGEAARRPPERSWVEGDEERGADGFR